ncbi:S-layer homology domain-containing protein [Spirulina sp. 06S082]|uniref:S-layer homology domain-containing protein n=1 Tax=Spirulina sp. 06S082 TaxID=3110248 RepID=UPI002B20B21A|nr:S-layer homology domain-containing protein [Spirulina sp. 06S082]MEA5471290.1 S-layer homology domain-containing protein [Spirulina sp. 06S082]
MKQTNRIKLITRATAGAILTSTIAIPAAMAYQALPTENPDTPQVSQSDRDFTLATLEETSVFPSFDFNDSALEFSNSGMAIDSSYQLAQFQDLTTTYWAANFISQLLESGVIKGFPNGRFLPENNVTRAQFAAMISKAFSDRTPSRDAIAFSDVPSNHWAYQATQNAYKMGFLSSLGGQFDPNRSMTRLDVLTALTQGLGYSYDSSPEVLSKILGLFNDANLIPSEARSVVAIAAMRGMLVNYPNVRSLNLTEVATRADVAAYLYQALVSSGKVEAIASPYAINLEGVEGISLPTTNRSTTTPASSSSPRDRQNCNQGIGNGSEGCDPGNSRPHGGSNDEGGRVPGNRQ